jgi:2-oxo-4-hydroxy-4-carboxy-5-ureidoimidazoline decarboxylase
MNAILASWNHADENAARDAMIACCGSKRWAAAMVALRPIASVGALSEAADRVWAAMWEADWLEAFAGHPRIGERQRASTSLQSVAWSKQEQAQASTVGDRVLAELAEGNNLYEQRFGFTFIVCATGKSAEEMLGILNRRLAGGRETELREAAEQQRQIMQIRLEKWLVE